MGSSLCCLNHDDELDLRVTRSLRARAVREAREAFLAHAAAPPAGQAAAPAGQAAPPLPNGQPVAVSANNVLGAVVLDMDPDLALVAAHL